MKKKEINNLPKILTLGLLIIIIGFYCFGSTVTFDRERPLAAITALGFTEVETVKMYYPIFACADSDIVAMDFTAINSQDEHIQGTVCCGWFKYCTVRF